MRVVRDAYILWLNFFCSELYRSVNVKPAWLRYQLDVWHMNEPINKFYG